MMIKVFSFSVLLFLCVNAFSQSSKCKNGNCVDGWGDWSSNNGTYIGKFKNEKFNGLGIYTTENNIEFIGYFENNKIRYGYYLDNSGNNGLYSGAFVDFNFSGYGIRIPNSKDFYIKGFAFTNGIYNENSEHTIERNKPLVITEYKTIVGQIEQLKDIILKNYNGNGENQNTLSTTIIPKDISIINGLLPYENGFFGFSNKLASNSFLGNKGFFKLDLVNKNFHYTSPRFSSNSKFSFPINTLIGQGGLASYEIETIRLKKENSSLFSNDGFFVSNNTVRFKSLIYFDLNATKVFQDYPIGVVLERIDQEHEFEKQIGNKTFHFQYNGGVYSGNSIDKYFIRISQAKEISRGEKVLVLQEANFNKDNFNVSYYAPKIFSINRLLEKYEKLNNNISFEYKNKPNEKNYDWSINQSIILKDEKIAVPLDLFEHYEIDNPYTNFPIQKKIKKSIVLIFSKFGKSLLSHSKIISADFYYPSNDGGFYAIIKDGVIVYKYDNSGNVVWKNIFGKSTEEGVKHDFYLDLEETDDNLFITGVTTSKNRVGKQDPIFFSINKSNGNLFEEKTPLNLRSIYSYPIKIGNNLYFYNNETIYEKNKL